MEPLDEFLFDEVGFWSEIKQDIVQVYAERYTKILLAQSQFYFSYIEGFSSSGLQVSKATGEFSFGSTIRALTIDPPFDDHHFVDISGEKLASLKALVQRLGIVRPVNYYEGDCNTVLIEKVFPQIEYRRFRRALCLLDPYGLNLDWRVISTAGKQGTIDLFINFPVMDANRNALWRDPNRVRATQAARFTRLWGDDSWREIAYEKQRNLFGDDDLKKTNNETLVAAFRERLRKSGPFEFVPQPIPMRNEQGGTIYYLFFASQKAAANNIASYLFEKYRTKGAV